MYRKDTFGLTILFSVLLLGDFAVGNDGLCGVEAPKDGGSCSSSGGGAASSTSRTSQQIEDKIYEKLVFEDFPENETEIWARRFYSKVGYTTKYDWPIRNLLDDAEDFIANDAKTAIDKLNAILEKYPDSPRGKYNLVRAIQYRFYEREREETLSEEDKLAHSLDLIQRFVDIMSQFRPLETKQNKVEGGDEDEEEDEEEVEYVLPPSIFNSAVQQALFECDNMNLTKLSTEVTEKAMEVHPQWGKQERYHILLIEKYFVLDDLEAFETSLERAQGLFPDSILLKFFKGILLKRTGQKKEGNKMLREIEYEGDAATQFADEMRQLGHHLYNRGQVERAHDLFRETSKVHGFMSLFQRPVMSVPDLEAVPVWNAEEQVSLTKHDEEFQILTERWQEIREDVFKVSSNLSDGWLAYVKTNHDQNMIVGQGNWSVFPLFAWGKKKAYSCSRVPTTCSIIKEKFPLAAQFPLGVVKYEILAPKTGVIPHCGPINSRLRLILPLQVPKDGFKYRISKDTPVPFVEGKIIVIDDSFEHVMFNDSDEQVIWLTVDFPHPDLPFQAEKKTSLSTYAKHHFIGL